MVVIGGWRSTIAEKFRIITSKRYGEQFFRYVPGEGYPLDADRYLFCQGLLYPKTSEEQSEDEVRESLMVNYFGVVALVTELVETNDVARICVIGSESAYRGSHDSSYSYSKLQLHRFIESYRLRTPQQQLVCVSPSIIEDSGMTQRRKDVENLERRRLEHPMKRFLRAEEVARMAVTLLYDQPYVSGTVIRMHGGMT